MMAKAVSMAFLCGVEDDDNVLKFIVVDGYTTVNIH